MKQEKEHPATEALVQFLRWAVVKDRSERYLYLAHLERRRKDFLGKLDHDLGWDIERRRCVLSLSERSWSMSGWYFCSTDPGWGQFVESLRAGYDRGNQLDGYLLVGDDGRCGIYRGEAPTDELFFELPAGG